MRSTFVCVALLTGFISAAEAQVSGTRSLPDTCPAGTRVDVVIDMTVGAQKPTGVIVDETLPTGWTLVSSSVEPDKPFDPATGTVSWLFRSASGVTDKQIMYTAEAAGSATGEQSFSGTFTYNNPEGVEQVVPIGGEDSCNAVAGNTPTPSHTVPPPPTITPTRGTPPTSTPGTRAPTRTPGDEDDGGCAIGGRPSASAWPLAFGIALLVLRRRRFED